MPFSVLTDAAPTVAVQSPSGAGARAGGAITLTLSNWITSDGDSSPQFVLLALGADSSPIALPVQSVAGSSNPPLGSYTFSATLPALLNTPASYFVAAQGECGADPLGGGQYLCAVVERSPSFNVAPGPSPTATPVPTPTSKPTPATSISPLIWLAAGAVLVLLLLFTVVALMRRAGIRSAYEERAPRSRSDRDDWVQPGTRNRY